MWRRDPAAPPRDARDGASPARPGQPVRPRPARGDQRPSTWPERCDTRIAPADTLRGSGRNLRGLAATAEPAREWMEATGAGQGQPSSRCGRETSSERDGRLGMTDSVDTGENRPATATGSQRRRPEPPSFDNGRPRAHGRVACHRSVAQPARRRIGGDRGSPLRDFYVAARLRRRGHASGRSSVGVTTSHAGAIRMCLQRMTSRLVGWIPQAIAWRLWRGRRTRRI